MMVFRKTKSRGVKVLIVAVGLLAGTLTGLAFAKATQSTTLKAARNAALHKTIVVDSRGRTVYELKPETAHHLLCTSAMCLQFWPPVTVRSAKAKLSKATGIKGKLGTLHRGHFFQVTLGGLPLYRFANDKAKGQANGNGISAFGGTWHVVTASSTRPDRAPRQPARQLRRRVTTSPAEGGSQVAVDERLRPSTPARRDAGGSVKPPLRAPRTGAPAGRRRTR